MSILDYYLHQNKDANWFKSYSSTEKDLNGSIFINVFNTNSRTLLNLFENTKECYKYDGKTSSEINKLKEEKNYPDIKHKKVGLKDTKFYIEENKKFLITDKGKLLLEIENKVDKKEMELIIAILLINSESKVSFIKKTAEFTSILRFNGISTFDILEKLKKAMYFNDYEEMISSDIFWFLNFYKDSKFIRLYISSTITEKEALYKHVIHAIEENDRKDVITKKYKVFYGVSRFQTDIKLLLLLIICLLLFNGFDSSINLFLKLFENEVDIDKITKVINDNRTIFEECYNDSILKVHNTIDKRK